MFQKQLMMRRVLIGLIPIYLFSIYLYGWRLLLLGVPVFVIGIGIEYFFEKGRQKKVSEAVLVTCSLYLLSLPARTPWWIAIIGIAFGVLIAKEIFGGFGRNIFNPAICGRLFVYLTFPGPLQESFPAPGNFGLGADTLSSATPLAILRSGESFNLSELLLGLHAGSMGESSVALILLAALFLIITKTASWRIILSTLGSAALLTFGLELCGAQPAIPPLKALLSGSLVFVAVFYATDPVSAPKKKGSLWFYGIIIGSAAIIIRTFSLFPEGTSFGILLGNTFTSLLDRFGTGKRKGNIERSGKGKSGA